MLSSLFSETKIDAIIVGAERIAANGDVISTIGTYQLAILAKFFNILFIVAAPSAVIDLKSKTGKDIEIEKFSELEVTQIRGEVVEDEGNVKEPMLFNSPSWDEEDYINNDIYEMGNDNNETSEFYTEDVSSSETSFSEEEEEEEEEEVINEEIFNKNKKDRELHVSDNENEDNDSTFKSIHSYDEITSNNDVTSVGGNDTKSVTSFDSNRSNSIISRNNSHSHSTSHFNSNNNNNTSPKVYSRKTSIKDFSLNTQTLITKLGQNVIDVLEGIEERMRFSVHGAGAGSSSNGGNNTYQMRRPSSLEPPITSMTVKVSTPNVHVYAPAYDITPSHLISAIITDKKVLTRNKENDTFDFQELFK